MCPCPPNVSVHSTCGLELEWRGKRETALAISSSALIPLWCTCVPVEAEVGAVVFVQCGGVPLPVLMFSPIYIYTYIASCILLAPLTLVYIASYPARPSFLCFSTLHAEKSGSVQKTWEGLGTS